MQRCKNCSNQFKWKNIIKSIWFKGWGYSPIVCDVCGAKHFINLTTRLIVALSVASSILLIKIVPVSRFENYYMLSIITLYIIWLGIIICITPFFARYHMKPNANDGTKALLTSNLNEIQADLIILILESYNIPFYMEYKSSGNSIELYKGANNCGIDIFVQPNQLQIAKELINEKVQDN